MQLPLQGAHRRRAHQPDERPCRLPVAPEPPPAVLVGHHHPALQRQHAPPDAVRGDHGALRQLGENWPATAPPIVDLNDRSGLLRLYRWMLRLHRRSPEFLRLCFRVVRPFAARRIPIQLRPLFLKIFQPMDADVLRDSAAFDACFESARRAWRGSAEGVMIDAQVYAEPWGFRLEDINVPVRLWHGTKDRAFSFRLAEQVAARLPNCRLRIVDGAGHFSLPIRFMHDILADLISV